MQFSRNHSDRQSLQAEKSANGSRQDLRRGETLYAEDDAALDWFVVASGVLRTCRYLPDGHRQVTGFYFAGDVVGLEAPIRRTSAEAVTDVSVMRYDRAVLDGRDDTVVASQGSAREVLLTALDAAEGRIELLGLRSASERVAGFLLRMDGQADADGFIYLPMGRADIADYLALTVETVSRTLSLLGRRKLLAFRGPQRVKLLNRETLEDVAGGKPWVPHPAFIPAMPGGAYHPRLDGASARPS
jgi:CRP/FNR family nitrogen fixation transcriptional regulator